MWTCSSNPTKTPVAAIAGEAFGLVIALIILTVVIPLLAITTPAYQLWLPIGIQAAVLTAFFHIIGYSFAVTKPLAFSLASLVGIYSTYYLLKYFPFDFAAIGIPWLNQLLPLILAFSLIVMTVTMVVGLLKWFFSLII